MIIPTTIVDKVMRNPNETLMLQGITVNRCAIEIEEWCINTFGKRAFVSFHMDDKFNMTTALEGLDDAEALVFIMKWKCYDAYGNWFPQIP